MTTIRIKHGNPPVFEVIGLTGEGFVSVKAGGASYRKGVLVLPVSLWSIKLLLPYFPHQTKEVQEVALAEQRKWDRWFSIFRAVSAKRSIPELEHDFRKYGVVTPLRRMQELAVEAAYRTDCKILLALATGVGKTLVALTLASVFKGQGKVNRVLVVCPASVKRTWAQQIAQHTTHTYSVIQGPYTKTVKTQEGAKQTEFIEQDLTKDFVIVNYDVLSKLEPILKDRFDMVIFDESAFIRNPEAKRTKTALLLSTYATYAIPMSGFPFPHGAEDAWSQLHVGDKGEVFGSRFSAWRNTCFDYIPSRYSYRLKREEKVWVERNIEGRVFSATTEECVDLPDIIVKQTELELSPKQQRVYKDLEEELASVISVKGKEKTVELTRVEQLLSKLLQVSNGWVYGSDGIAIGIDSSPPKIAAMMDTIQSIPDDIPHPKVIVWAAFRPDYDIIAKALTKHDIGYVLFTGGLTEKQRDISFERFLHDSSVKVAIANWNSVGVGTDLLQKVCATNIYFSYDFSADKFYQSLARTRRIGQTSEHVLYEFLYSAESVDGYCLESLFAKVDRGRALQGLKAGSVTLQGLKGVKPSFRL